MIYIIERHAVCGSTNRLARERAREGAPAGTVVVADGQTDGQGTRGRSWFSPPGAGLCVSVVLRPASGVSLALLPLAAGLAAREAVERTAGVPAKVRWPNDIIWNGKKIGGILCESGLSGSEFRYAIVGLGLNTGLKDCDFPPELRPAAASLGEAAEDPVDRETLLQSFLEELEVSIALLIEARAPEVIERFLRYAEPGIGDAVLVRTSRSETAGRLAGFDLDGSVRMAAPRGLLRFSAAEIISLRPAPR